MCALVANSGETLEKEDARGSGAEPGSARGQGLI